MTDPERIIEGRNARVVGTGREMPVERLPWESECGICGRLTPMADLRTLFVSTGEALWECRKCQAAWDEATRG
jgi:hypothetical protein